MKVVLINPPWKRATTISRDHMAGFGFEVRSTNLIPPLSLAYAASVLLQKGFEVEVLDAVALGMSKQEALSHVLEKGFHLACVNTATPSIKEDISFLDSLKELNPHALYLATGPHVSHFAEEALLSSRADGIIRGPLELTLLEVAEAVKQGASWGDINGLSYRSNSHAQDILHTPDRPLMEDLDDLPFPARHLLPMNRYHSALLGLKPFTTLISSQGCPYPCTYCPYRVVQGSVWRPRRPQRVVDELEVVVKAFGVKEVLFRDPVFTLDRQRTMEIAQLIRERGLEVTWRCETRIDLVDEELLKNMAMAGLKGINLGFESASPVVLQGARRKPFDESQAQRVMRACEALGIKTMVFFILGLPGEDERSLSETLQLARRLRPDYAQFTIATPYPGTDYYHELKEKGLLEGDWSLFTSRAPIGATEHLTNKQLQRGLRRAYFSFYLQPHYIVKKLRGLREPRELQVLWQGFRSVLRYAGL